MLKLGGRQTWARLNLFLFQIRVLMCVTPNQKIHIIHCNPVEPSDLIREVVAGLRIEGTHAGTGEEGATPGRADRLDQNLYWGHTHSLAFSSNRGEKFQSTKTTSINDAVLNVSCPLFQY